MEATTGFEPVNGSFADFCLTTWRRRHRTKMVAHPHLHVKSCPPYRSKIGDNSVISMPRLEC